MSIFVAAFIIQWWALALYGIWQLIVDEVPLFIFQLATTFSNLGGVLNGVVYFILRRQRRKGTTSNKSTETNNLKVRGPLSSSSTSSNNYINNNNNNKRKASVKRESKFNTNDSETLLIKTNDKNEEISSSLFCGKENNDVNEES